MTSPSEIEPKVLSALTRQPDTSAMDVALSTQAPAPYVQAALDNLVREGMVERHRNGKYSLSHIAVESLSAALVASLAPTDDEQDDLILADLAEADPTPEQMAAELHEWATSQDSLTPHDEALVSAVLGNDWRTAPAIQAPTVYSEHLPPGTGRFRSGVWVVGPRTSREFAMARHPSNSAGRR